MVLGSAIFNRLPLIHTYIHRFRLVSCYRDREGAGESFSNQRSEEGAARLAGTRGRHHDTHRKGLRTRQGTPRREYRDEYIVLHER